MRQRGGVRTAFPAAAIAVAAAAAPFPLSAETVRIRTGEHDGFTRIVAETGAADWTLGRAGTGYELRLRTADAYDLSDAFRLIGRTRVADLSAGSGEGALRIDLGCDCHAKAFTTPAGALVIDIADGAPDPASPFEARLETAAPPSPAPAAPGGLAAETVGGGTANAPARDWSARPAGAAPDPRLALFWRGIDLPGAAPGVPASSGQTDHRGEASVQGPARDTERRVGHHDPALADHAPGDEQGDAPLGHGTEGGRSGLADPNAGVVAALDNPVPEAPTADLDAAGSAADTMPTSEGRLAEAQQDILRQLSRAASQGLVTVDAAPGLRARESGATADREGPQPEAAPPAREEPLAVHVETSVDRDALSLSATPPLTADGGACLPDSDLSIADWGDARPPAVQIAERRNGLVGEFDRPSEEAVLSLARLYLYLGFGAESRAVLRSFDVAPHEGEILSAIGLILDGTTPGEAAAFSDMTGCNGAVALWALMAWQNVPPMADVDGGAVVRSFSALPPHLRQLLGPGLSERLIGRGLTGDARAIRNAIVRVPEAGGPALDMVAAQVDVASGDVAAGERRLDALAMSNDPLAPDALILAMDSRLARGEAVAPALTDSAEAIAFEQQDGANGPRLTSLHILGRASTGEFDRAFAAWPAWPAATPPDLRADTALKLFAMLAEKADDATFLRHYFRDRGLMAGTDPDILLRLDLAERLSDAGFPDEVDRLLRGEAGRTERGRRLLAAAALARFDAAEAIARLEGLSDPGAATMRAEALAMIGDHAAATEQFRAAGKDVQAGLEAWRAGDRALAASLGPEPLRTALESLTAASGTKTAPPDGGLSDAATPSPGLLASGRQLVRTSQDTRSAIAALLSGVADGAMARATAAGATTADGS